MGFDKKKIKTQGWHQVLREVILGETSENRAFADFRLADDEDFCHEILFVDVDHRGIIGF